MLIAPEEPGDDTLRVPVLRVFDGDGFLTRIGVPGRDLEIEAAVRFGFIDAPELGQPGGYEARDFLAKLIDRQWLDLVLLLKMNTGRIIDGHGRIVAVPYLRQQDSVWRNIELEMVLNGWAWVLERYDPEPHYFEALENAQHHRRGIWARPDNLHPWEFKKQTYRERRRRDSSAPHQSELFANSEPGRCCPKEGCQGHLVRRTGRFGMFYGCSRFPDCRYSSSSPP